MAGEEQQLDVPAARHPNWTRRILIGIGGLVAALLVLGLGVYIWLDTQSGRNFVANQIRALEFDNGMKIEVGRIEGAIFRRMKVGDLSLRDPKGVFLTAHDVDLDWRPLAYLGNHLDIRGLSIPEARYFRNPVFKPVPASDAPLLPDLDVDIGKLRIDRLQIDPAVTGQRHLLRFTGAVHIADRRAQVRADGLAIAAPGLAGGDRVALVLDATPDDDRFDLDLKVNGPANGFIAGMTGVAQPLNAAVTGKGDWRNWNGKLTGTLGGEKLADVALGARSGAFVARGLVRPGLFLTGPGRNMLEPVTQIALSARPQERRMALDATLGSDNFAFSAKGGVDLGQSRLSDMRIAFRLLKPSVIAQNLTGAGVVANATLNGAFVAPQVAYRLNARELGFAGTVMEGLAISGSAALDKDQWRIPVQGRVRRIAGLNPSIAPLLTNVRLDGDFAYANARLLSDNIRLRSDRIDATAVVVADMNRALYTGALNGRVNGYQVASIGIFNVSTNMDLKSGANGYFKLGGRVTARSTRLLNDGMRSFLGGNALIVADVGYDSNGVASLDRLNIAAPDFRLTGGRGSYGANGAVRFAARGSSDQYGPLGIDVTGSVSRPVIRIAAARPGLGVGLAQVVATVRGEGDAYAVIATGDTDYGPLAANLAIVTGRGPLAIDIRDGTRFSGVGLTGRIVQSSAGPFTGALKASGSGINGTVALSSTSGKQRAVIDATARNASLNGAVGLSVDRAIVKADIILYDQPQVVADVQLAGARMGELTIAGARANINYRGGRGQAKLLAEGRTRYPFRLAANADLQPSLWRVALAGRLNGIDVATRGPMRILPEKAGYVLQPSTLSVDRGALQVAGRYGRGMALQARMNGVSLAILNPFAPSLGLGGMATGSLDFAQTSDSAFPIAEMRLNIDDFTRTSLAAISEPVDMNMLGRLAPTGGTLNAVVRRRGAAIGRMQMALSPLPAEAGSWTTRLMAAPLSGGIRYNGPADVLFSLAALPDQSLKGPIGLAADFAGRMSAPSLVGVVRANSLIYENAAYGTRLTNMAVRGRFTNARLQVESLTARAGQGTVSASGSVSLSSAQGFPIQLGIDMNNAQLASGQDLAARASGQIRVVNAPGQPPTISGTIDLPETRYRIARQGAARVATLSGIRRKVQPGRERISGSPEPMQSLPSTWRLDVAVKADNRIYVSGMGLESEWAADIRVRGTSGAPQITGGINLVRGTLGFAGRSFALQEGRLRFNGGDMTNPELRIVATSEVEDVDISITITGSAGNPQIAFSSTPNLPQDELMARILFGSSVGQLSAVQALQLASSLNSLRGSGGGLNPLGVLQSASGIDRLRILGADKESGRSTSLAVGQYISNDVYVAFVTDARGYTATQLEVSLSKALSVLSQMGSFGGSSVNLRYKKDY